MDEQLEGGPQAGAGWYPDPEQVQTQRYWDGQRWTEQRAPLAPSQQESTSLSLTPRLLMGLLGSIVVVIATFLPHADSSEVLQISRNTLMQNGDGIIFVVLAVGAAAAAYRASNQHSRSAAMVFIGLAIMALAYYEGTGDRIAVVNGLGAEVEATAGVGIWAAGIGGLLIALAGSERAGRELDRQPGAST